VGGVSSGWYGTMVHELAHMWFGNSVTNKTWNHVWLNEGFASYAEALFYEYHDGIGEYHAYMDDFPARFNTTQTLFLSDDSDYTKVFSSIYYDKGAWVLHMLRGYLNNDTQFFGLIKAYAQNPQFRYKDVTTDAFQIFVEEYCDLDLQTFFDQWIYDKSYPDYEFNYAYDAESGKTGVTIYQSQFENSGDREVFEMYVPLKFTFSDGTSVTQRVFNNKMTQTFYFDYTKTVTNVQLDPEEWIIRSVTRDTDLVVPPIPQIKTFSIPNHVNSTINQTDGTIAVTMPFETDRSALTPAIGLSANSTVSPLSGDVTNFTTPVTYTVTTSTGTSKAYTVTVTNEPNSANLITSFAITGQVGGSVIDNTNNTVAVIMPFGTDRTALEPTITLSTNASVEPLSGVARDFSSPVTYTVTAENGSERTYTVTVTNQLNNQKRITSFTISGQVGGSVINNSHNTIAVTMPYGTDKTALEPTIDVSANATVNPASGVPMDFTSPVVYTVTAENGTTKTYSVTVTNQLNSANQITIFTIIGQVGGSVIDHTNNTIAVTMPYGTDKTALEPTIDVSANATVNPASGVAHNFSSPVTYTVTAENGTQRIYTVTVTNQLNSENLITSFAIADQVGGAVINNTTNTVAVIMPYGTDRTALAPTITLSDNAAVAPLSGVARDFSSPVTYTVTAENGTQRVYTVTVTNQLNSENLITSFAIADQVGGSVINNTTNTVTVIIPYGTDRTALAPTITLSPNAAVAPLSGVARDFSNPVTYTVTAENGTQRVYTVTVTNQLNSENLLTSFAIADQVGGSVINNSHNTIAVTMPYGTDRTALAPIITLSPNASVAPLSGVARNFSSPVTYTVTAENGTQRVYTVTVTNQLNSENLITSFAIADQVGGSVINNTNNTVAVVMPCGTDRTALAPTITLSPNAAVAPLSGVARDFSSPVTYTVTAENGTQRVYTVTVTNQLNSENLITSFAITGQVGGSVINNTTNTVAVTMPYGTDKTALAPTITLSDNAAVEPLSGVARDFSSPVTYTVTAENGTQRVYTVTVTNQLNSENLITSFAIADQVGGSVINNTTNTVAVTMPYGTDRTALAPTITLSPNASVAPLSGVPRDFSSPGTYTVTAENGTQRVYTVTVTNQLNSENLITSFAIADQVGGSVINNTTNTVAVIMPYGTDKTALAPTITLSDNAAVEPLSGVPRDFSSPGTYTVTAENGTQRVYTVTVTNQLNSENLITSFAIADQVGGSVINNTTNTVAVTMPYGTDKTALEPTIAVSADATVNPASDVATDFSNPVDYTVTAENGTPKTYTVTVTNEEAQEIVATWTGSSSTLWTDDDNWDIAGGHLDGMSARIVSGVPNFPVISINTEVLNLTIEAGASLTQESGQLNVTGSLRLKSTPGQNASYLPLGGTLSVAPEKVHIEQVVTSSANNYAVSSPVSGPLATKANAGITGNAYLFNNPTNSFVSMGENDEFQPGMGFVFKSTQSVEFSGVINTSDYVVPVVRTPAGKGWNHIGNPYTAAVDWNELHLDHVDDAFWVYLNDLNTYGVYNNPTGLSVGLPEPANVIPSKQAIWVRVSLEETGGSVGFSKEAMTNDIFSHLKTTHRGAKFPYLKLEAQFNGYKDATAIAMVADATFSSNDKYDSEKRFSNNPLYCEIYTLSDNKALAIGGYPPGEEMVIPIGISIQAAGTAEFSLGATTLPKNSTVYLKDKKYGTTTQLTPGVNHAVNIESAGKTDDRFDLVIFNDPETNIHEPNPDAYNPSALVYKEGASMVAEIFGIDQARYHLYEMSGKKIQSGMFYKDIRNIIPIDHKGVLLLRIEWDYGHGTYKVVF
jgi:large repetitive protein